MSITNDALFFPVSPELCISFYEAIKETFVAMFGNEPVFLESDESHPGEIIIGIISLVGDIKSSMILMVPKSTATTLALKFTCSDIDYDSPDMSDIIGEISNIIAGDVVARLKARGIWTALSLPMIARGTDAKVQWPSELPSRTQRFTSSDGEFRSKIVAGWPGQWWKKVSGLNYNSAQG